MFVRSKPYVQSDVCGNVTTDSACLPSVALSCKNTLSRILQANWLLDLDMDSDKRPPNSDVNGSRWTWAGFKSNQSVSQFIIFIGTVIYIYCYRVISHPDWVNLRTWFLFFHQNIEQEIVESVKPEHGQKTAWNAFVLKNVGIFLLAMAPVLIPPVGFIQQDLNLS